MKGHSHWLGELFINEGPVRASELVEIGPVDCGRHWEVYPICLGWEQDILPIMKGAKPIPEDMHPRRRTVLERVPEANRHGGDEVDSGATGLQRGGNAGTLRRQEKVLDYLRREKGFPAVRLSTRARVYLADEVLAWLKQQARR